MIKTNWWAQIFIYSKYIFYGEAISVNYLTIQQTIYLSNKQ